MAKTNKLAKLENEIEKPLALKYVDTQAEIIKKFKLQLTEPGLTIHPKFLYLTKDGVYKFRINYMDSEHKIIKSKSVSVKITEGVFDIKVI